MSDPVNIHASCVAIGNKGVLLLGKSGAGKSDLTLRLIDGGARLVTDDRTLLFAKNGALHARAPAAIRGLLEMRGVGIIELPVRSQVRLALAVLLGREGARLPKPQFWQPPAPLRMNTKLPQIALNARYASAPAKVRAAVEAFSHAAFRDNFNLK
jgi:hypothetical protein